MAKKYGYDILVIPNDKISDMKKIVCEEDEHFGAEYCFEDYLVWMERERAEEDSAYKQPIPYVYLEAKNKVALFQRYKGGEQRLAGKHTVGIGGHVERCDALNDGTETAFSDVVDVALHREIAEEIIVDRETHQSIVQLDYSDTVPFIEMYGEEVNNKGGVNDVHIGLPFALKMSKKIDIRPRGDELKFIGWFSPDELLNDSEKYDLEDWSIFVLKNLSK